MWDKKISTENSVIPLLSVSFFDTRFFLKHRRVALRFFLVLSDTDFDKNRDTHPPSLIHKLFRYTKFSESQKGCPTKFFGTVRDRLWQKVVIRTHFLLPIKMFGTRSLLKGFPYDTFWYCETKTLTRNRDTSPSSLIHKSFQYTKFSETQTCSPTTRLDTVGQKLNGTKNDIPFLCVKFFETRFFLNHRRFPFENFRYCETTTLTKNRDTTPFSLIHNIFRYQIFSETEGFLCEKFW